MKENIKIKLFAYKKGTPRREIKKLIKAIETAWEEIHPGEKIICIPVESEYTET